MHNADILDAVSDVIGPDILCWTTNFFIKEPSSAGFVSWHQDSTYWGLDPDDVVTAWVAFTDAVPENGYMQFIPGTHKVDQLPHLDTFHRDNLLSRGQEIAVDVDTSKAVGIALQAGEMSLHHIKLVHGSEPNQSNDRRIGLAIRYIPTYVRQTKVRDAAMLVHGTDKYGHFDNEPQAARGHGCGGAGRTRRVGRAGRSRRCTRAPTSRSSAPDRRGAIRCIEKARPP